MTASAPTSLDAPRGSCAAARDSAPTGRGARCVDRRPLFAGRRPHARERGRSHRGRAALRRRRSSGVESRAGHEGPGKVAAFVAAVRRRMRDAERSERPRLTRAGRFGDLRRALRPRDAHGACSSSSTRAYDEARARPAFRAELDDTCATSPGGPTPLDRGATPVASGARRRAIYLKREDLLHTGAHKINNAIGQALLARRMGKTRVIAETGAGQHGVATATAGALLGLECVVYMGEVDMERQRPNVYRMRLLGAEVRAVDSGSRTLKDAINEAMRDWVDERARRRTTSSARSSGRIPIRRWCAISRPSSGARRARRSCEAEGRLPDLLVACVGGGTNAIGLFHAFLGDAAVAMVGVEAGGDGIGPGEHAARFAGRDASASSTARARSCSRTTAGQVRETHSVSAGLDYPAVGPEHARLAEPGRARYDTVTDDEALAAFHRAREHGGDPPRARDRARAGVGASREAPRSPGRARRRESLGPRRQGRRVRREARGRAAVSARSAALRAGEVRRARRARRLRRGGRSGLATTRRLVAALAEAGADVGGARGPVLRPDRGRPRDPARLRARARRGTTLADARPRRGVRGGRLHRRPSSSSVREPGPGDRRGRLRAPRAARRGSTASSWWTSRRKRARACAAFLARRARPRLPPRADVARSSGSAGRPRSRGFVYLVSRTGVTGARAELAEGLAELVARVQAGGPGCPSPWASASRRRSRCRSSRGLADGVVVGSAVVGGDGDRRSGRAGTPWTAAAALVRALAGALAKP